MRVTLPLIAGAVGAMASGLDFDVMLKADPKLKTIKPTPTTSIDRVSTAQVILSRLSSSHSAQVSASSAASKASVSAASSKSAAAAAAAKSHHTTTTKKGEPAKTTKKTTAHHTTTGKPKVKRATVSSSTATTCPTQTYLYGSANTYVPSPNTPLQFSIDTVIGNISLAAQAPAGWTRQYVGLSASFEDDAVYLGYTQLANYDAGACANFCTAQFPSTSAFNLYFERDPSQYPGPNCPNPTGALNAKCACFGAQIGLTTADNYGEYLSNYVVMVAGSNLYWKNSPPPALSGYQGPNALAGFINLPNNGGASIGNTVVAASYPSFFAGVWDPSQCSAVCTANNAANYGSAVSNSAASYTPCNYFDAAKVSANGALVGTYCMFYTTSGAAAYANLYNDVISSVNYIVTYSYGYQVNVNNTGTASPPFQLKLSGSGSSNGAYLTSSGTGLTLTTTQSAANGFQINMSNKWLQDTASNSGSFLVAHGASSSATSLSPLFTAAGATATTSGANTNVLAAWNTGSNAFTFSSASGSAYTFQLCSGSPTFATSTLSGCTAYSLVAVPM